MSMGAKSVRPTGEGEALMRRSHSHSGLDSSSEWMRVSLSPGRVAHVWERKSRGDFSSS